MFKICKILILSALGFMSFNAQSAIISIDGFVIDINGLDWLALHKTSGLTQAEALAANSGFRAATLSEVDDMFSLFASKDDGAFFDQPNNDYTFYETSENHETINAPFSLAFNPFFNVFGPTKVLFDNEAIGIWSVGSITNDFGDRIFYGAYGVDRTSPDRLDFGAEFFGRSFGTQNTRAFLDYTGHFLVRDQATPVTAVSEPTILALISLGIFGVGMARRKRHQ